MSDKSWDADAELGSGRTLDFGGKAEDLGDSSLRVPDSQPQDTSTPTIPTEPSRPRRPTLRLSWIVTLVILFALVGPLFGVITALITAFDDISESLDSFEETTDGTDAERPGPVAPPNLMFLRTLDAAVSGTASALPQCFFDEASSDLCSSTYAALADLVDSTSVNIECSAYRAFWVNALRSAADGRTGNLEIIYDDADSAAYPAGYAEARTRCVGGA